MPEAEKIEIENVNIPGRRERVDRAKYMAMREALLKGLTAEAPGITVAEAKAALLPHLSEALFPGGAKAGWWLKAVQLDLEAKGVIGRSAARHYSYMGYTLQPERLLRESVPGMVRDLKTDGVQLVVLVPG